MILVTELYLIDMESGTYTETFSIINTIFPMDSEMPIRNIHPIDYSQVNN